MYVPSCVLMSAPPHNTLLAHTNTHMRGVRSNPVVVSCVNKANSECRRLEREQWVTLLSDVPLCCCCLSLQVMSYHACVCGLFLIPYLFYTLSFSTPSDCRVRAVVCACVWLSYVLLFLLFLLFASLLTFFYTVLIYVLLRTPHGPPPRQAETRCCSGMPYLPLEKQTNEQKESFPALFTRIQGKPCSSPGLQSDRTYSRDEDVSCT